MANTKNYSLRERIIEHNMSKAWYTRKQIEADCNRELEAHGENAITSRQTLINDFLNIERKYNTSIDTKRVGRNTYYRLAMGTGAWVWPIYLSPRLSPTV